MAKIELKIGARQLPRHAFVEIRGGKDSTSCQSTLPSRTSARPATMVSTKK